MTLEATGSCFVCGERNEGGLRLAFQVDRDTRTLRTTCRLPDAYQGWDGIVHGGLVATLLDEAMGKLAQELGRPALTAALEVRFRRPARIADPIVVEAAIDGLDERVIAARARAVAPDGTVLAEATARLMPARAAGGRGGR